MKGLIFVEPILSKDEWNLYRKEIHKKGFYDPKNWVEVRKELLNMRNSFNTTVTVKDIRPYQNKAGDWFVELVIEEKDKHHINTVTYPKIHLNLDSAYVREETGIYGESKHFLHISPVHQVLHVDDVLKKVSVVDIPEQVTLEEIEKRLGYKVELVSKKGD